MRSNPPYILLFDGECRICSAFARAVRRLDVRRHLSVRPIQGSEELLQALPAEGRLGAAHAIGPDGRLTSGGEAMPAILAALVADTSFERRIRGSRASMSLLAAVYRIMAEVRGQLSCAVAPAPAARIPG